MFSFLRRLSRDRFANRMMKAIATAGGPSDFVYDRDAYFLRRPETIANLGNAYQAYQQAKGPQRQQVFDNFVTAFAQQKIADTSSYSAVESKLVAVARERAFLAALEGPGWGLDQATDPKVWPAQQGITKWFSKAIVIDYPTHVAVVNETHLKDWNVTFDEAFAIGLEKLRADTMPQFRQENGYHVGTWNDDYDSCRVLLPFIFDDLPLNGDPVVTLPNRLTLMVAGSNDPDAIRAMLLKAEEVVRSQPKPQNPSPLVSRDGKIEDFNVDESSPIFHDVQRARRLAGLCTYEDQKVNLDRAYEKIGKDIFVGSFNLMQTTAGAYETYSVWSKDVPTLLPETDVVMFFDGSKPKAEQIVGRANWQRVREVLGNLMLDTKMFPPRYYVSKFPADAQLNDLKGRD
jgi:hypothetical protein